MFIITLFHFADIDDEDDIDLSSLTIVDPASDAIHIDHCYTNRLRNHQILQLSVGQLKSELLAQLEDKDGVENCPAFRQDTLDRGKLKVLLNSLYFN